MEIWADDGTRQCNGLPPLEPTTYVTLSKTLRDLLCPYCSIV